LKKETRYTALLTGLLLLPAKNYFVYYGLVLLVFFVLFFFLRYPKFRITFHLEYTLLLLGVAITGQFLRILFLSPTGPWIRDFYEFARFLPVILVLLFDGMWDQIEYSFLFRAAYIYVVLDLMISIVQLFNIPTFGILSVVKVVFNDPGHFESSLRIAGRTLGLSAGPGQHGLIVLMLFFILFAGFITRKSGMKDGCTILGIFLAVLDLLLTQSQSSFAALLLGVCILSFYLLVFGMRLQKKRVLVVTLVALVVLAPLVVLLWDSLRYLSTLFVQGISRHAYTTRQEKWAIVLGMVQNKYLQLIVGFGKQYFEELGTAMDNEFLFFIVVYGVVFSFLLYSSIALFLFNALIDPKRYLENAWRVLLLGFLISGMVISWPSSFLLYPPVSVFYAVFLIGSEKEAKALTP
jgi:hypothetical protein